MKYLDQYFAGLYDVISEYGVLKKAFEKHDYDKMLLKIEELILEKERESRDLKDKIFLFGEDNDNFYSIEDCTNMIAMAQQNDFAVEELRKLSYIVRQILNYN